MKHLGKLILIWVACSTVPAWAQNQAITEPQMFYRKRIQLGANLNTSGLFGLNFKYGWHKTGTKKNMLDVELARVRHHKETRIYGASDNPQEYTFGRLNMAFFLRTGYGQTIAVTERPYKNAVGVNFNYNFGLNTAFLKPIYLDIQHTYDDKTRGGYYIVAERYDPVNVPDHNNQSLIYGNSSFFEGFDEIFTKFGAYGRVSLSAEWGAYPDEFYTLELGATLDVFPDPLPLMASQPKSDLFLLFFVGFNFGWNK